MGDWIVFVNNFSVVAAMLAKLDATGVHFLFNDWLWKIHSNLQFAVVFAAFSY